jgi:hypothetical protein
MLLVGFAIPTTALKKVGTESPTDGKLLIQICRGFQQHLLPNNKIVCNIVTDYLYRSVKDNN